MSSATLTSSGLTFRRSQFSSCLSRSVGSLKSHTVLSLATIVELRNGAFGGLTCGPSSTNFVESMNRGDHAWEHKASQRQRQRRGQRQQRRQQRRQRSRLDENGAFSHSPCGTCGSASCACGPWSSHATGTAQRRAWEQQDGGECCRSPPIHRCN
jgi:hypothetical protein